MKKLWNSSSMQPMCQGEILKHRDTKFRHCLRPSVSDGLGAHVGRPVSTTVTVLTWIISQCRLEILADGSVSSDINPADVPCPAWALLSQYRYCIQVENIFNKFNTLECTLNLFFKYWKVGFPCVYLVSVTVGMRISGSSASKYLTSFWKNSNNREEKIEKSLKRFSFVLPAISSWCHSHSMLSNRLCQWLCNKAEQRTSFHRSSRTEKVKFGFFWGSSLTRSALRLSDITICGESRRDGLQDASQGQDM